MSQHNSDGNEQNPESPKRPKRLVITIFTMATLIVCISLVIFEVLRSKDQEFMAATYAILFFGLALIWSPLLYVDGSWDLG